VRQLGFSAALLGLTMAAVLGNVWMRGGEPGLPGTDALTYPPELSAELRAVPSTSVRTRHLLPDGSPKYTNRLVRSSSPYLLQHAHNPVNWFPWGDEAFELAKRLNRPVFLSIGYATCHWCHVMEEESFEDPEIAALLNAGFIAIKVDREARPDVDGVYMEAVKALHGSGGWPATVWLTPDKRPFFAATYIPARDGDRGVRTGLKTFLAEIARTWTEAPDEVQGTADRLTGLVQGRLAPAGPGGPIPEHPELRLEAWVREQVDREHGGRQGRQKFPGSLPLRAMLASKDAEILGFAEHTLQSMAAGGVYDQVAGGFHRYAVDPQWKVPHFEKTLYDNALLARIYAEAFQRTGDLRYAGVTDEVLAFLSRDLGVRGGGFASAVDADSLDPTGVSREGAWLTWTRAELDETLGSERATRVAEAWGITGDGPIDGRHVPAWTHLPTLEERRALGRDRLDLMLARSRRTKPLRDEKVLVGWNGLAIAAFAHAGWLLGREDWIDEARGAADAVLAVRREGRLPRLIGANGPEGVGFLEDHAWLIDGLLTLFEATGEGEWLDEAVALAEITRVHHADAGAWFGTPDDHEVLLVREKPDVDRSWPNPNAVMVGNFVRLAALTGDDRYRSLAEGIAVGLALDERPFASAEAVLALSSRPLREIVLVVGPGQRAPGLLAAIRTAPPSTRVFVRVEEGNEELVGRVPMIEGKVRLDGLPTVYVCQGGVCDRPVTDPEELAVKLRR
jgi:uncharacterized protein YyaL (SSP411 family)